MASGIMTCVADLLCNVCRSPSSCAFICRYVNVLVSLSCFRLASLLPSPVFSERSLSGKLSSQHMMNHGIRILCGFVLRWRSISQL